jgi:hypothetical protein
MKRMLMGVTIGVGIIMAACNQQPKTNNSNTPDPADTATSSPNAPTSVDTGMMKYNDSAARHSMQDSAMPK